MSATVNTAGLVFTPEQFARDPAGCVALAKQNARREGAREWEVVVGDQVKRSGKV